jgi:N-acetylmuramoyl-L-alanine amidase
MLMRSFFVVLSILTALLAPPFGAAAQPSPQPGSAAAVAVEARVEADADRARLIFTLSKAVEARWMVLENPDRIVVDLPTINFQLPPDVGRRTAGLVRGFRYGLFAPGRSRIVIDLVQPALPVRIGSESIGGVVAAEFVLELRRTDRAAFTRAAAAAREPVPSTSTALFSGRTTTPRAGDDRPVVVIDPGHGGIDAGATGIGNVLEKDVVFAFSQLLRTKLERSGKVRVAMTRDTDVFIALDERVRLARQANAALFVSIHADSLANGADVRGLTVYTGSDMASDAESARLAEAENRADQLAGVEQPANREDIADILDDLTKRETRTYSTLFARTLVAQMGATGKLNKNPHRSAGFRVLRAPDVPSALVELGYLSSRSDSEMMQTAEWRERSTDLIAASILDFLEPQIAQRAARGR